MEKAIGYVRTSTSLQGNSIDVQPIKIKEYCRFKGLDLVDIIVDEDISGGSEFNKRPGGAKANAILTDTDVKIIVCVKPDRIFRSVKDSLITVDSWSENGISLHIVDLGGNSVDVKTALGRMFFIQTISMGEFERRVGGERTSAILSNKKQTGAVYCGSILGYDKSDNGKLIPNEAEQKIIREILELSKMYNNNQIALKLNAGGAKTKKGGNYHASTIKAIRSNKIHLNGYVG